MRGSRRRSTTPCARSCKGGQRCWSRTGVPPWRSRVASRCSTAARWSTPARPKNCRNAVRSSASCCPAPATMPRVSTRGAGEAGPWRRRNRFERWGASHSALGSPPALPSGRRSSAPPRLRYPDRIGMGPGAAGGFMAGLPPSPELLAKVDALPATRCAEGRRCRSAAGRPDVRLRHRCCGACGADC